MKGYILICNKLAFIIASNENTQTLQNAQGTLYIMHTIL